MVGDDDAEDDQPSDRECGDEPVGGGSHQVLLFGWLAFEGVRRNYLLTVNQREAADLAAAFRSHDDATERDDRAD